MIHLVDVAKQFGPSPLFEGVGWRIGVRDRIGLVGANGSGKTTLLRLIEGTEQPDHGEIIRPGGHEVGYLAQEVAGIEASHSILAEVMRAFSRLMDMGVEPYLVASAVEGIVAQRLVRRLCAECRKAVSPSMAFLQEIGFPVDQAVSGGIYEPGKCEACRSTGFHGRSGIFEIMPVTDAIQSHIIGRHSAGEVKQEALKEGMRTLRDDGWDKALAGITTIEEVLRATEENA